MPKGHTRGWKMLSHDASEKSIYGRNKATAADSEHTVHPRCLSFNTFAKCVLMTAVLLGGPTLTLAARLDGRELVAGRQAVKAVTAASLADGRITRSEYYKILSMAQTYLSPNEYAQLRQSLNQRFAGSNKRLSVVQNTSRIAQPHFTGNTNQVPSKQRPDIAQQKSSKNNTAPRNYVSSKSSLSRAPAPIKQNATLQFDNPSTLALSAEHFYRTAPPQVAKSKRVNAAKFSTIDWLMNANSKSASLATYHDEKKTPLKPIPAKNPFRAEDPAIGYGDEELSFDSVLHEPPPQNPTVVPPGSMVPSGPSCQAGCQSGCQPDYCEDVCNMPCCDIYQCQEMNWHEGWKQIQYTTSIEAFKGPLDLDDQSGNFGFGFALNGGFPLSKWRNIGLQVGTSAVLSDLQGTRFTGDTIRSQNFTTVGLFQRIPLAWGKTLKWGFAFDWMIDDYYTTLKMSQWRVKLGYELNPCSEIGMWACIPNVGDTAQLNGNQVEGEGMTLTYNFEPIAQGNFYWRHCWANESSLTGYVGIAEEPGEVILGGRGRIPFSPRLALVGNFNYILPSASGQNGRDEEMWHVSLGIQFTPGCGGNRCRDHRFSPIMPLADNGIFSVKQN